MNQIEQNTATFFFKKHYYVKHKKYEKMQIVLQISTYYAST